MEVQSVMDRVAAHAAADCEGEPIQELYMICEGTFDDVMDGRMNCYPHDPFLI
jgi:hypothetical protein